MEQLSFCWCHEDVLTAEEAMIQATRQGVGANGRPFCNPLCKKLEQQELDLDRRQLATRMIGAGFQGA